MEHVLAPLGEIHIPHNWEFASAAARTSAAITDTALVGGIARQLDDNSYWTLTAAGTPATWTAWKSTHTHVDATPSVAGFMSAADKQKLNSIAANATQNATDAQLRDRATHTGTQLAISISDLGEAIDDRVAQLLVAGANVTLQYNDNGAGAGSIVISSAGVGGAGGGLAYQTTWNAATNTPTLSAAALSSADNGKYWKVSVAGATNLSGISSWAPGDWVMWNGSAFDKIDNTDAVVDWLGLTGSISRASALAALSLGKADVGLGNVDNTSDANKPVSAPQQAVLDTKADQVVDYRGDTNINGAATAVAMGTAKTKITVIRTGAVAGAPGTLDIPNIVGGARGNQHLYLIIANGGCDVTMEGGHTFAGGYPGRLPGDATAEATWRIENGQILFVYCVHTGTEGVWACFSNRSYRDIDLTAVHAFQALQYQAGKNWGDVGGAISKDVRTDAVFEANATANISAITWTGGLQFGMVITGKIKAGAANLTMTLGAQWRAVAGPYQLPTTAGEFVLIQGMVASDGIIDWTAIASNAGRIHLGTMSETALRAGWANGSGALAGLPLGSTVFVSDVGDRGVELIAINDNGGATPNVWAARAESIVQQKIGTNGTPLQTLNANAASQILTQATLEIPPILMRKGARFRHRAHVRGQTAASNLRTMVGPNGTLAGDEASGILASSGLASAANQDLNIDHIFEVRTTGAAAVLASLGFLAPNGQAAGTALEITRNSGVPQIANLIATTFGSGTVSLVSSTWSVA